MINFFNEWAQGIIIAVIIAAILEMLIPNANSKKYIKSIIGIYILYTIVVPVINKISGKEFSVEIEKYMNVLENNTIEVASIDNNSNIKEIYVVNLKSDISSKLENKGYKVKDINIIVKDNDNLDIEKIDLQIEKLQEEKNEDKNENKIEVKINEIKIDNNDEDSNEKVIKITKKEETEVKEFICDTYNVEKNNIEINKGGEQDE